MWVHLAFSFVSGWRAFSSVSLCTSLMWVCFVWLTFVCLWPPLVCLSAPITLGVSLVPLWNYL
jgi:hypothetical protein